MDHVVLPLSSKVAPAMIKKSQNINVFQAKKTDRPDVYSVKIAPKKPPLQIELSDKRPSKSFKAPSYSDIKPQSVLPSTTTETYQGIVDFGGDHAPIYISISKKLTQEEEKTNGNSEN